MLVLSYWASGRKDRKLTFLKMRRRFVSLRNAAICKILSAVEQIKVPPNLACAQNGERRGFWFSDSAQILGFCELGNLHARRDNAQPDAQQREPMSH